jgi:hypothetical protein
MLLIDHDEIVAQVTEYFGGVAARRLDEGAAELFAVRQPAAKGKCVMFHGLVALFAASQARCSLYEPLE